ncbi:Hypothetical_protein [Hexamita inflata]|uniref:Hypothetical_protein n=1 Tax=Hexamita inflata TaxID=28002 RepID=A0AA86PZV5_9EUKA|nr:Hypothetical protein HINF_LOCUS37114 [Hexamita inflata]
MEQQSLYLPSTNGYLQQFCSFQRKEFKKVKCGIKNMYIWLVCELRIQARKHRIVFLKKKGEYKEDIIRKTIRAHSVALVKHDKITKGKCILCFKQDVSCYCSAFFCKNYHILDCVRSRI